MVAGQRIGGANEREVRERLRRVPRLPLAVHVVLLREQSDIVREAAQPGHERHRVIDTAAVRVLLHEPERARQERMLGAGESVHTTFRAIAVQQPIHHERALHLGHGPEHARIVVGHVSDLREQQERRIHLCRAVVLHEVSALGVEAALVDLVPHPIAQSLPLLEIARQPELTHGARSAVESRPDHDSRVGEQLRLATDLPDAVVRLVEVTLGEREHRLLQRPREVGLFDPGDTRRLKGHHHLSDDITLVLHLCPVADPHGGRALVPGKGGQLTFCEIAFPCEPVHDLQFFRVTRDRPQQPLPPPGSHPQETVRDEGLDRQRRIA